MKSKIVFFILILISVSFLNASKLKEAKFGIQAQLMGPTTLGVYFDFKLKEHIYLDFAIGQSADIQFGAYYSFLKREKRKYWFPYIGAQITYIKNSTHNQSVGESTISFYLPVGLRFLTKDGYTFAFEVGYNFVGEDLEQSNTQPYLPAIRLGKYF